MPIYDQESLEPKEIHPGVKVRIMHGENIMMMLVDISPGATVPTHTHENEQGDRYKSISFNIPINEPEIGYTCRKPLIGSPTVKICIEVSFKQISKSRSGNDRNDRSAGERKGYRIT